MLMRLAIVLAALPVALILQRGVRRRSPRLLIVTALTVLIGADAGERGRRRC